MKDSKKIFNAFGFMAIALCALCCLIPVAGLVVGVGAIGVLTGFFKWAGIAAIASTFIFSIIIYVRNIRRACRIDCTCKEKC
jgi:hypothetical protein